MCVSVCVSAGIGVGTCFEGLVPEVNVAGILTNPVAKEHPPPEPPGKQGRTPTWKTDFMKDNPGVEARFAENLAKRDLPQDDFVKENPH